MPGCRVPAMRARLLIAAVLAGGCGGAVAATGSSSGGTDIHALPLGDGHVSSAPRSGYVDSCVTNFGSGQGSQVDGPWIDATHKTWDYSKKLAVNGSVHWPSASYKVSAHAGRRTITFNDLPINHTTGVFPIASSDPAYQYDRNPNRIAAQSLSWSLPLSPKAAHKPSCTNLGPIGVLDDGVVLFNALDAQGHDAGAHEVLDRCAGHPDPSSTYHHHDIPPCILSKAPDGRATLVGYAIDGYGIYVVKDRHGTMPTNRSLDSCHGQTSKVPWNGKLTRIYHYVGTLEYPYTVGCFHGTPLTIHRSGPPPPGH